MATEHVIHTLHARKCLATLSHALVALNKAEPASLDYDVFRAACVKEFEIVLEQCGTLLKKSLRAYAVSTRQVDELNFKDVFRHGGLHGFLSIEQVERWLKYRDNRNETAHDYGENFANETLKLLEQFIEDASHILNVIDQKASQA
jgi:nucleotidyltransferase substrate binding protein (TIGR01987 family)